MAHRAPTGRSERKKKRPSPQKRRRPEAPSAEAPAKTRARPSTNRTGTGGRLWLYGRHAVEAALLNPKRTRHVLLATEEALGRLDPKAAKQAPEIRRVERAELDVKLGDGVVHQGLALAVAPLPALSLAKACRIEPSEDEADEPKQRALVLALDRINDPHNLGAILRSAVAFGARAAILPHRQSAELGGAVAKAASGGLDILPIVEVTNLSRALDELKELGYWRAALDGRAEQRIDEAPDFDKLALVIGAEGKGVRRLVAEHCDLSLRLPISEAMESLNASVACGIALYALTR
jgi:23S rRNA (guanosine2251-2'-O)-methyltransferase